MLLSNIFSNKLNELVNSFDKEDVISCRQNRYTTSPQLPATRKDRVASYSQPEK